jgi:hypothetical protein
MSESKIIEKIQKLLALAEGAGTEEEAETVFAKARSLMVQHAVEEMDLVKSGHAPTEKIVERHVTLRARDERRKAKSILLNSIALANRCKVLLYRDTISIIGYESDTVFVEMLWTSVLIQMANAQTREWGKYQHQTPSYAQTSRYIFVNQFSLGYAAGVGQRLIVRAKADDKAAGTDLVLRDRSQDVDDWFQEQHPSTRKTKAVRVSGNYAARSAGTSAAASADLSGGRNNVAGGRNAVGR